MDLEVEKELILSIIGNDFVGDSEVQLLSFRDGFREIIKGEDTFFFFSLPEVERLVGGISTIEKSVHRSYFQPSVD